MMFLKEWLDIKPRLPVKTCPKGSYLKGEDSQLQGDSTIFCILLMSKK